MNTERAQAMPAKFQTQARRSCQYSPITKDNQGANMAEDRQQPFRSSGIHLQLEYNHVGLEFNLQLHRLARGGGFVGCEDHLMASGRVGETGQRHFLSGRERL